MSDSCTWVIGGEAGFGIMTTGLLFTKTCARAGYHVFGYPEYPSLIRGGHNVFSVRFSTQKVYSQEEKIDLLAAMNRQTFDFHKDELKESSGVIFDPDSFVVNETEVAKSVKLYPVPLKKIASEIGVSEVMVNNIILGFSAALFGLNLETMLFLIRDQFLQKGEAVINENQKAAKAGYEYVSHRGWTFWGRPDLQSEKDSQLKMIMTGNEAVSLAAISAGCKFYAAYPMTPSSSILHVLAEKGPQFGIIVRHAEDEIGVINEAVGASFAGARAMVGTSGGGFALMTEAVSLAGITETPLVIVVSQRPGPATGMPTWTEQGDLLFIVHSGHGEFPKIVLAPGDVERAIFLTKTAFNLADIYQCPVIIVLDKYLSESLKSLSVRDCQSMLNNLKIEKGKLMFAESNNGNIEALARYRVTDDGISERVIPGTKGYYFQTNSYEHLEDGFSTENPFERKKQVEKRGKKLETFLKNHFHEPEWFGEIDADITLIGWGSIKGPVLEAVNILNNQGHRRVNFLHFTYVWPLERERILTEIQKAKRLVLVENNSSGQFSRILRQETGIEIREKILKYDGRPFYPEEIVDLIETLKS